MVGDQRTLAHRNTLGALLLQAVVLLGFAALAYLESLSTTYPLTSFGNHLIAIIFGVLGAITIWLAGEHNSENVRSSRLKLWAIICIVLSLIPLAVFTGMFLLYYSVISLVSLIQSLLFLIPSILVLLFSRKEIPSN